MFETVLAFGLIISAFEFVIICMLPPRTRLRMLGSKHARLCFHVGMLFANFAVHWGTAVGTMSATLAFICSLAVLNGATRLFGHISDGRYYHVGIMRYSASELK